MGGSASQDEPAQKFKNPENLAEIVSRVLDRKLVVDQDAVALRDCFPADCQQFPYGEQRWRCMFALPQNAVLDSNSLAWIEMKKKQIDTRCRRGYNSVFKDMQLPQDHFWTAVRREVDVAYESLKARAVEASAQGAVRVPPPPSDSLGARLRRLLDTKQLTEEAWLAARDIYPEDCEQYAPGSEERAKCIFGIPQNLALSPRHVPEVLAKYSHLYFQAVPFFIDPKHASFWRDVGKELDKARGSIIDSIWIRADPEEKRQIELQLDAVI
jgi:hypothetical protein